MAVLVLIGLFVGTSASGLMMSTTFANGSWHNQVRTMLSCAIKFF